MIYLFVDTNIYLNFFDLNRHHLSKIGELVPLINKKKINLFVTQQVVDEFYRNREKKLKQTLETIKVFEPKLLNPIVRPDIQEIREIQKLLENIERLRVQLVTKFPEQIKKKALHADRLIEKLFGAGEIIQISETVFSKAKKRRELGNPPGKANSNGDAINWESLLENIPMKKDLYFITGDKDYLSPLTEAAFSVCLMQEWERKKKSKIHYYVSLSHFLGDKFPSIKIKKEEIREEEQAMKM
ncbi:MAG: PIN domain-containing protein [Elusimicrobiota bacterium]